MKKMKMFKNTLVIGALTIHYDEYFDKSFVADVNKFVTNVSKSKKTNMNSPKYFENIHVFVYANVQDFNKVFSSTIEKRYYEHKRAAEDMYIVQDSEGNIHIASPSGKDKTKRVALAQILAVKIMSQYVDEKEALGLKKIVIAGYKKELEKKKEEKLEEEKKKELEQEKLSKEKEQEEEKKKEKKEQEKKEKEQEEEQENIEDVIVLNEIMEDNIEKGVEMPSWMSLGWYEYLRGRLQNNKDIERFSEYVSKKGTTSLSKIKQTKALDSYNCSKEFAVSGIKYIIDTYSIKKLKEVFEEPSEAMKLLHTTKYKFNRDVKAYIYENYSIKEMKFEIEKEDVREVSKINFTNNDGIDVEEQTISKKEEDLSLDTSME